MWLDEMTYDRWYHLATYIDYSVHMNDSLTLTHSNHTDFGDLLPSLLKGGLD